MLCALLVLGGCAARSGPANIAAYGPLDEVEATPLLEILARQREDVRTLRGVAKVRVRVDREPGEEPETFSTSQAILAATPASFRLDTLSAFGVQYSAVSNGDHLAILAPNEDTVYRGEATPATIRGATGVAATGADIARLLLGQPPMPAVDTRRARVSAAPGGDADGTAPGLFPDADGTAPGLFPDADGTAPGLFLHAPSTDHPGERVVVGFAGAPLEARVAVPVFFERLDARGRLLLRARFGEHRDVGGHVVPTRIEIEAPGSGVTLRYRETELNPKLSAEDFRIATPPGMRELVLLPPPASPAGP